jgi:hypothetical protein
VSPAEEKRPAEEARTRVDLRWTIALGAVGACLGAALAFGVRALGMT